MLISSAIFLILGIASAVYGISQNNNMEAQMRNLFEHGRVNPGTPYVVVGIVLVVIGIILLIVGLKKQK